MNWLFCCGTSEAQKNLERKSTLDLSKPTMLAAHLDHAHQSEWDELSGKPTAQSQKLNDILNKKKTGLYLLNDDYKDTGPFSSASGAETDQNANSQRMVTDKRLSNYLMQAQKIIQRKSLLNSSNREETDNTFEPSPSKLNSGNRKSTVEFNSDGRIIEEEDYTKKGSQNKPKNGQRTYTLTTEPDEQRQSSGLLGKVSSSTKNQSSRQPLPFKSNTNEVKKSSGTKNNKGQVNKVANNSSQLNIRSSDVSQIQNKNPPTATKSQRKVSKNKATKKGLQVETSLSANKGSKGKAFTPQNQTLTSIQVDTRVLHTTNGEESDSIYPSQISGFSFQPKYFKPQTTKADMSSHSSSGIRFFENSPQQKQLPARNTVVEKGSLQSTPGYSASSTIINSSKNPSILTKEMHPSFLLNHQRSEAKTQQKGSAFFSEQQIKESGCE